MNRLEEARKIVDEVLLGMTDAVERRCAYVHLYGVSKFAAMLALKRGLDPELGAVSGMFHDIYAYRTGVTGLHDQNGAEETRSIIRGMKVFSDDEQAKIVSAIFHHGDKGHVHEPYDELLKDADALQHYLYNTGLPVHQKESFRLESMLKELALPCDFEIAETAKPSGECADQEDKRGRLADIAERLASTGVIGLPEDESFRAICRYWPGKDMYGVFRDTWCAAFVYHCCMESGFILPIRHTLVSCRFCGVRAWLEWAHLPETGFFHGTSDNSFAPSRGDIVVFERLLTDEPHDHIGVVLSRDGGEITVAEGNGDKNRSVVARRSRSEKVAGFIRIDNRFNYEHEGRVYDPQRLTPPPLAGRGETD